jgi:hypothetical protein
MCNVVLILCAVLHLGKVTIIWLNLEFVCVSQSFVFCVVFWCNDQTLDDTNCVIWSRKSKKTRQFNDQTLDDTNCVIWSRKSKKTRQFVSSSVWSLYCLVFFDLRLLNTHLITSNFSTYTTNIFTCFYDLIFIILYCFNVVWFGFIVFNATFNNISAISWRSVLLVEETGGPKP